MCIGMFRTACHPIGTGLESEFELTGSNIYISCYVNLVFCLFHKGCLHPALFFAPWTTTYLEFVISCGCSPYRVVLHELYCLLFSSSYKSFEKRNFVRWYTAVNKMSNLSDYHSWNLSHLKYNSYHTPELYKLVCFAFALVPCVHICLYSCTLCDALVPCLMFEPHILSTLPLPACGYNMIVSELTFCTLSKGKLVRVTGKFPGKQKTKFKMENSNFT